ncbi:MAG: hypothetical protein ABSE56_19500 [Bryobacteraceae bacterium]|jgi:hypothetical protein
MRRALIPLLLSIALVPSAWLAWRSRDAPHLGYFHDDGLYWVCAKSLAEGGGYRIQSLPGEPYQTKYPPLYPLLLAGIWKLNPAFPSNLAAAVLCSWLMLAICLAAARVAFRDLGAEPGRAWVLAAVLALNPYYALCGISLLSELPFACLLLGALALIERARRPSSGAGLAAIAGLAASAACLTRSAGLLLLMAGPLAFLLRGQYRRAMAFVLAMLPGVVGWTLWTQAHHLARTDAVALYYTNYLEYYAHEISAGNLARVLWVNFDNLLSVIGGMLVFGLGDSFTGKSVARVLAVAAIAGALRLRRRPGATAYLLFTAGYLVALVGWNYAPDQRFLVPVFPVLLAGFATELLRLAARLRAAFVKRAAGERIVAGAVALALAGLLWLAGMGAYRGLFSVLPRLVAERRETLAGERVAYQWIAARTPADAAVLAYQDPILYLHTGRKACRLVVPPALVYSGDRQALERFFSGVADFAHEQRLTYAVLTPGDLSAELPDEDRRTAYRMFRANPRLKQVYAAGRVSVCRIE